MDWNGDSMGSMVFDRSGEHVAICLVEKKINRYLLGVDIRVDVFSLIRSIAVGFASYWCW